MKNLDIIITMAGLGSRFKQAGYHVPKYMIEVNGKTLFEWSMLSLNGYSNVVSQYIFIVRKEDNATEFIKQKCRELKINEYQVLEIEQLTDGQATTALLASEIWNKENGLLIYNIDTYVEIGELTSSQLAGDGFIPCFIGQGDHWSFVKINSRGEALEVREKERISDNCTLGAYYFKTCVLYEQLYYEYYKSDVHLEKGEKYVAPLYNHLISKGGKVFITLIDMDKIHVLGTPEEVVLFGN